MPSAQKAIAWPRFSGGNDSIRMACDNGCRPPPHAPCITRQAMRKGRLGARPQKNDAMVNPLTENSSRRFRPKRPASQPVMGKIMALATR